MVETCFHPSILFYHISIHIFLFYFIFHITQHSINSINNTAKIFHSHPEFYDPRSVTLTDQNLLVPGSLVLPTQKIQNQRNCDIYSNQESNVFQSGVLNIQCHREREDNKKKNNNSSFFNEISDRNISGQPSSSFSSSSTSGAFSGHTER